MKNTKDTRRTRRLKVQLPFMVEFTEGRPDHLRPSGDELICPTDLGLWWPPSLVGPCYCGLDPIRHLLR